MNHLYNDEFAQETRGEGRRGGGGRGGGGRGGGRRGRGGPRPEMTADCGAEVPGECDGLGGRGGFGPGRRRRGGFGPGEDVRPRARRGDVRLAALLLMDDQPMNGYQIMQRLTELSEGAWSVSSGAIYPAIAQLEDEGLVEPVESEGRKAYRTTEAGRAAVAARDAAPKPWELAAAAQSRRGGDELRHSLHQLDTAARAIEQAGDPALAAAAAGVLADAKRSLYRLLADGPEADAPERDAD